MNTIMLKCFREQKEWLAEELQKRIEEQENLARTEMEIRKIKDEVELLHFY